MKHVLVVDDNQTDRFLTRALVQKLGYVVYEVFDGSKVEHALKLVTPNLIIMDLLMPNKDGFETLEEIHQKAPDIPVIVLSCVGDEYKDKVMKLNAKACFQKPYDANEFIKTIQELVEEGDLNQPDQ